MITNPTSKFVQIRKEGGFDATIDWAPSFLPDPTLMHFKYISDDKTGSNYSNYIDRELDDLFDAQKVKQTLKSEKHLFMLLRKSFGRCICPPGYLHRPCVPMHKSVKGFTIAFSHILNNTYRGVYLEN